LYAAIYLKLCGRRGLGGPDADIAAAKINDAIDRIPWIRAVSQSSPGPDARTPESKVAAETCTIDDWNNWPNDCAMFVNPALFCIVNETFTTSCPGGFAWRVK